MTKQIFIHALFVLLLVACNTFPTSEQRNRYEAIQKTLQNNRMPGEPHSIPDSAYAIYNDVKTLSLDELIEKHGLKERDVEAVLLSLETSVSIINTFQTLDKKLEESQKEFEAKLQELKEDSIKRVMDSILRSMEHKYKEGDKMMVNRNDSSYTMVYRNGKWVPEK